MKETFKNKREKRKNKEDGDGNLESSGKKYSSNGSLVSQANGVKSGVKGEQGQIFVMNPGCSSLKNGSSMNSKELHPQAAVAENNLIDTVEFVTPSQNVRDIDNCKSISPPPPPCEIVSVLPHTPNTFTEIDKRTTHITTHTTTRKETDHDYLQPPSRGIDEFVSGEKGSCFIINTKQQGKINYHFLSSYVHSIIIILEMYRCKY